MSVIGYAVEPEAWAGEFADDGVEGFVAGSVPRGSVWFGPSVEFFELERDVVWRDDVPLVAVVRWGVAAR